MPDLYLFVGVRPVPAKSRGAAAFWRRVRRSCEQRQVRLGVAVDHRPTAFRTRSAEPAAVGQPAEIHAATSSGTNITARPTRLCGSAFRLMSDQTVRSPSPVSSHPERIPRSMSGVGQAGGAGVGASATDHPLRGSSRSQLSTNRLLVEEPLATDADVREPPRLRLRLDPADRQPEAVCQFRDSNGRLRVHRPLVWNPACAPRVSRNGIFL